MEFKTVSEFKVVEDRVVTGYPSVFGNVDDGGDLIKLGAYRKTIQERSMRFRWLWQHDYSQPPTAKILDVREVGREDLPAALIERYPEAEGALRVMREYLDTPRGNEILTGIKEGAINEMSIGYDSIQIEYPDDMFVAGREVWRILKKIRLWEGSDVNWGMNAATTNEKATRSSAVALLLAGEPFDEAAVLAEIEEADEAKAAALLRLLEKRRATGDRGLGTGESDPDGDQAEKKTIPVADLRRRVDLLARQLRVAV